MNRLALILLLLVPSLAWAQQPPKLPYAGTWKGTVGKNHVMVCFNDLDGQYYYLRHKQGIFLQREEQGEEWREVTRSAGESKETGIWKLRQTGKSELRGVWVNPATKEELPLALRLVETLDRNYGCSPAFYQPIVEAVQFKYSAGSGGMRAIKTDTAEAFELPESVRNAKKINAFIVGWMKGVAIESYECEMGGGERMEKTLELVFQSGDWLVLRDAMPDTYCGGAHPDWSITYLTFDLSTGKTINPWSWLKDGEQSYVENAGDEDEDGKGNGNESGKTRARKPPSFTQLINKLNPRAEDCGAPMYLSPPYPTANGLVFRTGYSHAARACEDEVQVSYKDLQPFLSPAGKRALKSITGK